MPRPRKTLPDGGLEIIRDMASNGVQETVLARALGLDFKTWKRIRDEDAKAQAAWEEAKALERDKLHSVLFEKAMQGDGPAAMFLLKCRHAYREQGPVDGEGGPSVTINLPGAMSPEEYQRLVNVTPSPRQIEEAADG